MTRVAAPLMFCFALAAGVPALALAQAQPMYGPSITADTAKKIAPAARFKRPTKVFQDGLAAGGAGLRLLSLEGAVPVEGGIPLVVGGKIVGAIGASGGTSEQDGVVANAAVA